MAGRVLADTGALLAVAYRRDQNHVRAVDIGHRHLASGGRFVSTMLVLAELHAQVLFRRGPGEARALIAELLDDPVYEWMDVPVTLASTATGDWLERFADQRFTLCDAVSFEVMRREKLTTAFAFDDDFVTAGFEVLR